MVLTFNQWYISHEPLSLHSLQLAPHSPPSHHDHPTLGLFLTLDSPPPPPAHFTQSICSHTPSTSRHGTAFRIAFRIAFHVALHKLAVVLAPLRPEVVVRRRFAFVAVPHATLGAQ